VARPIGIPGHLHDNLADSQAVRDLAQGLRGRVTRRWHERSAAEGLGPWRFAAVALLGAVAATAVGYAAAHAQPRPRDVSVALRVSIVLSLVIAGLYAQTSHVQARMGRLLVAAGLGAALWLLNDSSDRDALAVGVVASGFVPLLFCSLMLVHPTGRLRTSFERRFLIVGGAALGLAWLVLVLTSPEPPTITPLLRCASRCRGNPFFAGVGGGDAEAVLKAVVAVVWLAIAWGTPLLLAERDSTIPAALRRAASPVKIVAVSYALVLTALVLLRAGGSHTAAALDSAAAVLGLGVPLAILLGLGLERMSMGQALAAFVTDLARMPRADPQALMAVALRDPSLRIGYRRPAVGTCVDASGAPVLTADLEPGRAITWIERDRDRLAAVIYDAALTDQEAFVQAAGAAALMRLEQVRLQADLEASTADLAASRVRLVESAYAERQRIERDLHDGVQQDLVGLRIKLDLAAEAIRDEPARGERMLASVGRQMDDVLETLRSLARGIYPSLLTERGVGEAIKSAARRSPLPVTVETRGLGRCRGDVEVAVYFCCLEALQNAAKHAGRGAHVDIRLVQDGNRLAFEVRDSGAGFDAEASSGEHGLVNMRDRIEAVGGALTITSRPGRGTAVRGTVPIGL